MKIQLLFSTIILIFIGCGKTKPKNEIEIHRKSAKEYSPVSFIRELKKKNELNVSTIESNFSKNWVKSKDLNSLISLVDSKEKCNCYLNPLSSYIPKDSAEVGGFAIEFLKAFKENRKLDLGLYYCPKVNEKEAEELKSWWKEYNKHK
ncbi:hypothetical protein [Flavobacterium sangjuense]|uniref:Lipoprotein n=1 Tax=Flavobacterium sangjuense TaxID=2518177 RepID=A0A4P7PRV5_9FLAO|nr:hypothetical protein [Flavobacterium sangjuense]QBZ97569.1 hypothetical protein GS03_01061 [Flavobacterium sangjuense]